MSEKDEQIERAKRLRDQINRLKAGRAIHRPELPKSLREQIEERERRLKENEQRKPPDDPHKS